MTRFLIFLVSVGMLIDVLSCFLFMRRNRKGHGVTGIPIVTLILFYLLPLLIFETPIFTSSFLLDCLLLICFHVIVVFIIPILDRKRLSGIC